MRKLATTVLGSVLLLATAACDAHPLMPASALHERPPATTAPHAAIPAPVVGVDVYASTGYPLATVEADGMRVMRYIRSLHATGAGIVWNLCSPGDRSDVVTACAGTLPVAGTRALARIAETDGLAVQYRPVIRVGPQSRWDLPYASWEGFIRPVHQRAWFASLYRAELPYLRQAQQVHASQFVVATELQGLNASPWWPWFLAKVSAVYHGSVTATQQQNNYFARQYLPGRAYGVDFYPSLRLPDTATQAQVTAAWERSLARVPATVRERTALDEVGFASVPGAYEAPQKWNRPGPADYVMQARWFTAACETVARYHMRGLYFYEADLTENPAQPWAFPAAFERRAGAQAIARCATITGGPAVR